MGWKGFSAGQSLLRELSGKCDTDQSRLWRSHVKVSTGYSFAIRLDPGGRTETGQSPRNDSFSLFMPVWGQLQVKDRTGFFAEYPQGSTGIVRTHKRFPDEHSINPLLVQIG